MKENRAVKAAIMAALIGVLSAFCAEANAGSLALEPSFAVGGISTRGASAFFLGLDANAAYEFDNGFGAGIYGNLMSRPVTSHSTNFGQVGGLVDYRILSELSASIKCGAAWMFVRVPDYYRYAIYGAAFGLGAGYRFFIYKNSIAATAGFDASVYIFDGEFYFGYYGKIGAAFVF